jgi:hypothetical protein
MQSTSPKANLLATESQHVHYLLLPWCWPKQAQPVDEQNVNL